MVFVERLYSVERYTMGGGLCREVVSVERYTMGGGLCREVVLSREVHYGRWSL